ncbi:HspR, transcriptional repressor of DnaK operon [Dissulfuribacter thermophilus]|uniref:HspR, transcriptional repressor of DnaK operon n=1 Tax=Dissulfuribacter thermophilus TaxID=1156395 RepID=A0A1B9F3G5_9BACT|nr:chaperone modulator CbpM [Dissulfuribacter thermophilus]OCC14460.1 HspR, transcriptional repressor of DnaK operon [Dissulfuribacter thermophilus]
MTPTLYTFNYVCARCGISPKTLRRYIKEGLISPTYTEEGTMVFDEVVLERLEIIRRLRCDLGVNIAGIDIILRLISRIRELQDELDRSEKELRKRTTSDRDHEGHGITIMGKEIISIDISQG